MKLDKMLDGKVAVVTGASAGIGRAIADAFIAQGAVVCEVSTRSEKYPCDVSDFAAVKSTCDKIIADHGKIDILVNNAGITRDGLLLTMTEEDFKAVLDVNLAGAFNFTKHLSRPLMKSKCGRIINIASVIGISGNAGQSNYAASKAGLIGFTKSIAREFAGRGVTANAIAPGFIETAMTEVLADNVKTKIKESIPLKKLGKPEDVAAAALFLASDLAAYITGEVIKVDGGMCI